MTSYESIYGGGDNFLIPSYSAPFYSPISYKVEAGQFGMSLDPRTANQLGEVNLKINPGVREVEISGADAGVWESVPEQHLDEIRRQLKLTGVKPSLHAPVIEASGVGERGWEETNRLGAEKQLESAVLRSHKLDPQGNVSVTVHTTSGLPEMAPKIKTAEGKIEQTGLYVINPETGRIGPILYEKRYFPEEGEKEGRFHPEKPHEFNPEEELKKLNEDQWTEQLSGINRYANFGEEIIDDVKKRIPEDVFMNIAKIDINQIEDKDEELKQLYKNAQRQINHGQIYLRDAYRNMKNLFDKAYANATDADKEKLKDFAQEVAPIISEGVESRPENIKALGEVIEKGLKVFSQIQTPEIWKPLNEFIIEQSSKTFANVATSAYTKFKDKSPIINIENPPAGTGLSRAEDLKKVVEESRKKLAENLIKKGLSKGEAREVSEKMIGATWDVGHINMLRKYGYSEKDIIKETEKIAPYVKHVHLSDNFGFQHTELPMGMGTVPIKEMMEKLKAKGFKGQQIIEAGNWWQYFAERGGGNPFRPTIEAFDSPIYAMKAGPSWSQTGGYPGYYTGHGPINPPVHHSFYGAGFQNLPVELGGEIPGDRGRFAGTPNQ